MNILDRLLAIAKKDLKAAQCLNDAKLYPQAIFFLQQSVEKTFKALGALNDNLTIDEIKFNIGHHSLGVLSFMMEKFHTDFIQNMKRNINDAGLSAGIDEFFKSTNKTAEICKNKKRFEKIPTSEIIKLLPDIMSKQYRTKLLKDAGPEIESKLKAFLSVFSVDKKQPESNIEQMRSRFYRILEAIWEAELILTVLSLLFPPSCLEKTRYPTQDSDPLKIYTRRHPIVRSFRQVTCLCRVAQRGVKKASKKVAKLEMDSGKI